MRKADRSGKANDSEPLYKRHAVSIITIITMLIPAVKGVYQQGLEMGIFENAETRLKKLEIHLNEIHIGLPFQLVTLVDSNDVTINALIYPADNAILVQRKWLENDRMVEKNIWVSREHFMQNIQGVVTVSHRNEAYAGPKPDVYPQKSYLNRSYEFTEKIIKRENEKVTVKRVYKNGCTVLYDFNTRTGLKNNFDWQPGC